MGLPRPMQKDKLEHFKVIVLVFQISIVINFTSKLGYVLAIIKRDKMGYFRRCVTMEFRVVPFCSSDFLQ